VIRTAPEGRWFIVGAWLIALALILAALRYDTVGWLIAVALWIPIAVWVVAFFRDPVRDGKVVDVRVIDEPEFFGGPAQRICIFMNVFDCHVNRYPADGIVTYRHYVAGKFLHAAHEKSSLENEQSSVGLETAKGKILIRQIAGLIARRIVTDDPVGTVVKQGDRLGMIRFGSRVDLFIPLGAEVLVRVGDRTRAGITVVARWA
jgi:phosphatidylserine decarboxylase